MESDASAIARKIQNYIVIENEETAAVIQSEPGPIKNLFLISLMGLAVILTQITLAIVRFSKKIEG